MPLYTNSTLSMPRDTRRCSVAVLYKYSHATRQARAATAKAQSAAKAHTSRTIWHISISKTSCSASRVAIQQAITFCHQIRILSRARLPQIRASKVARSVPSRFSEGRTAATSHHLGSNKVTLLFAMATIRAQVLEYCNLRGGSDNRAWHHGWDSTQSIS